MIPYKDEVAFRREMLEGRLVSQPPAPVGPVHHFVQDEHGDWFEHPDVAAWHQALAIWGALPAVAQNARLYAEVEAAVFEWNSTGVRPAIPQPLRKEDQDAKD